MKKELNPPKFDDSKEHLIDFKRKNLWLTSIDGYKEDRSVFDTWLWVSSIVAVIVVLIIIIF